MLAKYDRQRFSLDATERPIERAKDEACQQATYSGKQKDHTLKNNLISIDTQQIVYLSPTYEGCVRNKRLAVEEACRFPAGSVLRMDLGASRAIGWRARSPCCP